jgi:hypothetical protein
MVHFTFINASDAVSWMLDPSYFCYLCLYYFGKSFSWMEDYIAFISIAVFNPIIILSSEVLLSHLDLTALLTASFYYFVIRT